MALEQGTTRAPVGAVGSKHVLVIVGSPHKGGATLAAARDFLGKLESYGYVTGELVALSDYDLKMCRGCKVCVTHGQERCPLKDDRDVILEKMRQADGVVFAAPNYSWQVPGFMKVFLDRLAFAMHRPEFHGKTASAIVVQGIGFGGRVRKYLEFVEGSLGFDVVKGSVSKTLEPMTKDAQRKMDENLNKQAARFHRELMKPAYRTPSLFKLIMFRMGRTGIRRHAKGLLDWDYYRDQGWFESDYYYPTHLGWPKKAVGSFADWFTARANLFAVAPDDASQTSTPAGA